ncbi:Outer membrane protein OmpA [Rhodoblastus acidophilus]|uniref:Outer membrane protein OmpA n=2 Tax=Rhodoblastus acidophilus TaxID=1074 RepID=A0A212RZF5_RHOAC|nr:OmpA family protein [Rhodoblastus acidophilus]PPQ36938.1 OmpA family protein [Rhodoblastus acidophilus]RAI22476.1 OmpA family protein [Rhodoblastus acidophilus]SNB78249.1 Outer membrane protein OmpA [Rhodoblastus acidophilus]
MMNIFAHYWGWLLLVTAIGFVGGMMVHPDDEDRGFPIWFWPLAGLSLLGLIGVQFDLIGAEIGGLVQGGAIAFFGFTLGALAGGFGKKFGLRWGPLLVAALVWVCGLYITPPAGVLTAAAPAPAPAAAPVVDAAKEAAAKAETDAKAAAAKIEEEAKAAAAKAEDEAKAVAAKAAEEAKAAAAKAEDEAKAAAAKAAEEAKAAAPEPAPAPAAPAAPATLAEKKAAVIAAAAALPASGPLDLGQCQTALSGLVAKENIKFASGGAKLAPESKPLIEKLGATLARCPATVKVEVAGHTDNSGDAAKNKALSKSRAQAVADALKGKGAKAGQLSAVGYGSEKPVAPNDTAEGKADNRRIEFAVK